MKQRTLRTNFLIIGCFFITFHSHSAAQSFIIKDVPQKNISVDFRFIHPFYQSPNKLNALSGTYDLNLSIPVGGKWNINTLVPVVVYKNKIEEQFYSYNYSYTYDKTALGNIYLGLQTIDSTSSNVGRNFSFGVFLPTSSKTESYNASFFGLLTNYYDLQKYLAETITLYSNIAFRWYLENRIRFGLDVGPQYLINISERGGGGNDFFLHYGLSAGVDINDFIIKSEFTGILILTGDPENFTDRFLNFLSIGLSYTNCIVKPSIFYQFNLHEMYENLSSGSLGVKLSFILD
ncbi:MAG: hypothetical protein HXY50_12760 [Ignavibacteriaceae bacterium]|nr:hypothetical protein [Ignavibacteriaceae bacterium]